MTMMGFDGSALLSGRYLENILHPARIEGLPGTEKEMREDL
jgi:hypothetical protein